MKQSIFLLVGRILLGSNVIRRQIFETVNRWDSYALLARANHQLSMDFDVLRAESAHLQIEIVLNACRHLKYIGV